MTDSELLLIDAQFWFDGTDSNEWSQADHIDTIYEEYGFSCGDWLTRSWFALLLSEVLK